VPPLPNVPQVILLTWLWTYGSDTSVFSRIHYKYSGTAPGSTNLATWCTTASNHYATNAQGLFHPECTLTLIEATDLTSPTAGTGNHAVTLAGQRAGTRLPASTAVLLNYSVGRRYRGGKMRQYVPMGVEADLATPQTWATAAITSFGQWFTMLDTIGGTSREEGPSAGTARCPTTRARPRTSLASLPTSGDTPTRPSRLTPAIPSSIS